jgi:diguanylate cyclase (GGDEF)-like protein
MWTLTIRSPKSVPRDHILLRGKNTIGRKSDNDIVINDELASRLHAEIDCQDDQVVIVDLGSTNGTFVNHKRLSKPQVLHAGDQIRIGYHLASISKKIDEDKSRNNIATTSTQPLTPDFMLESFEQNAVLIYEVANRLTTVLDLERILQAIAEFLQTAIGAHKCHVILANQLDRVNELGFPESIASQAIEERSVVIYPNVLSPSPPSPSTLFLKILAALCIPVLNGETTVALVYAYNQLLEKWALTDSLTGLDNRRHILYKAEIECHRARRFNHPLSAIMVDIDNFKLVNDTFGHFVGDHLMGIVAERCKQHLRNVDLFGRYGGDEFLIILVETSLDDAITAAERLSKDVSEKPVTIERNQINVTISMGIAHFSEDCLDVVDLIRRADDALLFAKGIRKNNIGVHNGPGKTIDVQGMK